jgi:hypothetical protein
LDHCLIFHFFSSSFLEPSSTITLSSPRHSLSPLFASFSGRSSVSPALHVPELGDDLSAILFAIIFPKLFRNG